MIIFFKNFFRLTRPVSNVKNVAIISLAFYLSQSQFYWLSFVFGAIALSLIFSGLYAYNTLCDVKLDKYNENKKHYFEAVTYFGFKKSFLISIFLAALGLLMGFYINVYFGGTLILLLLTGFLYSSGHTRFKEKVVLDVLFGASLTFLFRFMASWFIFSLSFPPLLPMLALVFLKNGGYMLYKGYDKPFLEKLNIKNSITKLSEKSIVIISLACFTLSITFFVLMCLNSEYFKIKSLGSLPIQFLFLLIFFIPPIAIQYLLFFKKIKVPARYMRGLGFLLLLILIMVILILL